MSDAHHPDPARWVELSEQDLAVATLVGRYIERRERDETPCVHDLLAAAAEFGATGVDALAPCSPATRPCAPTAMTQRIWDPTASDVDPRPEGALPCPNQPLNAPVVSTR